MVKSAYIRIFLTLWPIQLCSIGAKFSNFIHQSRSAMTKIIDAKNQKYWMSRSKDMVKLDQIRQKSTFWPLKSCSIGVKIIKFIAQSKSFMINIIHAKKLKSQL